MLHVVLVAPEIAANTGNIVRLCANAGAALHLVRPLGFALDEARLRRAGLDYHELTSMTVHPDLDRCLRDLGGSADRRFALSGRGTRSYDMVEYHQGDVVVFGAERCGLSDEQLQRFEPPQQLCIPMRPHNRSLNLANAVAVVLYEAWRQHGFPGAAVGPLQPPGTLAEAPGAPAFGEVERNAPLPRPNGGGHGDVGHGDVGAAAEGAGRAHGAGWREPWQKGGWAVPDLSVSTNPGGWSMIEGDVG